jgi:hypothetical protein
VIGQLRSRPCQSAFLDDKDCDSTDTFAALQISKNEGSLRSYSQHVRIHYLKVCAYERSQRRREDRRTRRRHESRVSSSGLADYPNRQPAFFPSKLLCYLSVCNRNDQQVVDCAYCSQERKPRTKLGEGEEDCELEGDSDEEGI